MENKTKKQLIAEIERLDKVVCQLETIRIMDSPLHRHPKLWDDIIAIEKRREKKHLASFPAHGLGQDLSLIHI